MKLERFLWREGETHCFLLISFKGQAKVKLSRTPGLSSDAQEIPTFMKLADLCLGQCLDGRYSHGPPSMVEEVWDINTVK